MRVIFMGTPQFAVTALKAINEHFDLVGVVTQPDRRQGRGQKIAESPVKRYAKNLDAPIFQPENVNTKKVASQLALLNATAMVVVAYGQILREPLLQMTPLGAINAHASLLPQLRGGAPIHWAILCGHCQTGVTTMLMTRGLDTGPILMQKNLVIGKDMTAGQLHDELAILASQLLPLTLTGLREGGITPQAQNHQEATYAPNLTASDRVIRWNEEACDVYNQVRGLIPWPVAYTTYNGLLVQIKETAGVSMERSHGRPGQVVAMDTDGIWVACGVGSLIIKRVLPQNKREMTAADFARGYGIVPGSLLGH